MPNFNRRHFLTTTVAAGLTTSLTPHSVRAANANDEINLGFISCGGRAGQLMKQFSQVEGVNVAGLCDADAQRVATGEETIPQSGNLDGYARTDCLAQHRCGCDFHLQSLALLGGDLGHGSGQRCVRRKASFT